MEWKKNIDTESSKSNIKNLNIVGKKRRYYVGKNDKYRDYRQVDGSPVPGLTLKHVLPVNNKITRISWSPDGKYLVSPSEYGTIFIWCGSTGKCLKVLETHEAIIHNVTWSPDSNKIATSGRENIYLWNIKDWEKTNISISGGVRSYLSWSPCGAMIALGCYSGSVLIISPSKQASFELYPKHKGYINSLAWSPDGRNIASASKDQTINIWETETKKCLYQLNARDSVSSIDWHPKDKVFIAGCVNGAILIWETKSWRKIKSLESHTDCVASISFHSNMNIFASKSDDNKVRIWNSENNKPLIQFQEQCKAGPHPLKGIAFHPHRPALATLGEEDTIIRIWKLDETLLLNQTQNAINYTTAKLVLVGDSGVGKTGLGWRMAHNEFKEHASTHGQQFWPIQQLNLKRNDGTDCEAVLWDLAGQYVYRQVHSIFLENVAAALVLFDPTNRQDPLKGAKFWLEQLKGKGKLPPTVLVGARVDRGSPALSQGELDQFCQQYGIKGGYLSTSAKAGDGLPELLDILKEQIPWDDMTATVTTVTFKRIKDYVLSLKEKTDRKGVLVSPAELRELLEEAPVDDDTAEEWNFTDAEMMTAVGHLDTHGYVAVLRDSGGDETILLTPDLLVNLAASIMLHADKNPRELGAVSETELLQGQYDFDELKGLAESEKQTLLDAAVLRFLEHNICFRDTFNDDTLLIFPSLIKQKRPLQDDVPTTDDISYVVRGRVENLYASLVVLLGHTPTFSRLHQWQNQAQYEMREGGICGFRAIEEREGELEMVLYYDEEISPQGREKFHELFEQFLYQREVEVQPFPPVVCEEGHPIERATVVKRVKEGKDFTFCGECGAKTMLPNLEQPESTLAKPDWLQLEEAVAHLRSTYEGHLTRIKGYRRGWTTPRAYLSHLPAQDAWVKTLVDDLHDAGVYIVENVADLKADDFFIILNTPAYKQAFERGAAALASDTQAIRARFDTNKVISIDCEGGLSEHRIEQCPTGDFSDKTHYSVSLFNLVMALYVIPLNHKGFEPLRVALHQQWENTLAGKEVVEESSALKIFISYSHRDEEFKDELVKMLAVLRRRKIVDDWQDRRIEPGDDWNQAIDTAMNECDLALLLVSPDYLNSDFIQEQEQPIILQRREDTKTRVIPIIVRPCMWLSEPALSGIQSLPRDNKAVITFAKDNGERDEVWTVIGREIEKRALAKTRSTS